MKKLFVVAALITISLTSWSKATDPPPNGLPNAVHIGITATSFPPNIDLLWNGTDWIYGDTNTSAAFGLTATSSGILSTQNNAGADQATWQCGVKFLSGDLVASSSTPLTSLGDGQNWTVSGAVPEPLIVGPMMLLGLLFIRPKK